MLINKLNGDDKKKNGNKEMSHNNISITGSYLHIISTFFPPQFAILEKQSIYRIH